MGKYQYPNVPAPSSNPTQSSAQHESQSRAFSWMPEPRTGKLRSQEAADAPPLPAVPTNISATHHQLANSLPVHQPKDNTAFSNPYEIQGTYGQIPHNERQPQRQSVATFMTGTPVPEYTREAAPEAQQNANAVYNHPGVETSTSMNPRSLNLSTRSQNAPEVFVGKSLPPVREMPPITENFRVEPDSCPLTPASGAPSFPPTMPNALYLPSNLHSDLPHRGGSWKHSLFSCADTTTCFTGLFCPCILYGKTQYRLGLRSENKDPTNMLGYSVFNGSCAAFAVLCGCNFILAAIQHARIRKGYNMSAEAGNVVSDCAQATCCCCCTIAQDEKEVKWRESAPKKAGSGLGDGKSTIGYQMQIPMTYPPPVR